GDDHFSTAFTYDCIAALKDWSPVVHCGGGKRLYRDPILDSGTEGGRSWVGRRPPGQGSESVPEGKSRDRLPLPEPPRRDQNHSRDSKKGSKTVPGAA